MSIALDAPTPMADSITGSVHSNLRPGAVVKLSAHTTVRVLGRFCDTNEHLYRTVLIASAESYAIGCQSLNLDEDLLAGQLLHSGR